MQYSRLLLSKLLFFLCLFFLTLFPRKEKRRGQLSKDFAPVFASQRRRKILEFFLVKLFSKKKGTCRRADQKCKFYTLL